MHKQISWKRTLLAFLVAVAMAFTLLGGTLFAVKDAFGKPLSAAAETDETRCAIVLELADFLLSGDEQARLASLGAFPVVTEAQTAYAEHLLTDWQAACGDIAAPDPFLYQRHREALEADALRALAGEAGGADAFSERFQVVLNR